MGQVCSTCRIEKPLEEFPVRRDRASGRGTICLECGRAYRRLHYARNREYYVRKAGRRRRAQDALMLRTLIAYLQQHPCVDCGETDITVLQFDHVDPRLKYEDISRMLRRRVPWEKVLAEIEKCEVRCGNCHRRRTAQQRRSGEIREDAVAYVVLSRPTMSSGPLAQLDRASAF